jgi:hypothetical protein
MSDQLAMHASAPKGYKCADCTIDKEACPDCYVCWWSERHPNTMLVGSKYERNASCQSGVGEPMCSKSRDFAIDGGPKPYPQDGQGDSGGMYKPLDVTNVGIMATLVIGLLVFFCGAHSVGIGLACGGTIVNLVRLIHAVATK